MKNFNYLKRWNLWRLSTLGLLPKSLIVSVLALMAALSVPITAFGQNAQMPTITGTVTTTSGEPMAGVTIMVDGTYRGVLTDAAGVYSIAAASGEKLRFSFLGYNDALIEVSSETTIDVKLIEQSEEIESVTIVAFGEQKKESLIASITTVRPNELKAPTSNLTTALAGRIAGLVAFQSSGEPGQDNADFFVRGVTSFGYSNSPLILVDGIEMSSSELARMQVDDISSFSLMKDATATALYGARGANGVIYVTTKEGAEGKARINFRFESALSGPTEHVQLADPISYMNLYNEAIRTRNPAESEKYSWSRIQNTASGTNSLLYPSTDWYNMLLKNNTWNNRYNLNVSGGGKVARYYVAATMNRDTGLLKVDSRNNFNNNIDYRTYGLRSNININITPTTELGIRVNSTWSDYAGPLTEGSDIYRQAVSTSPVDFVPYYPANKENETTEHILFGNAGNAGDYNNPYANLMRGYKNYTNSMFLAQFELKQKLDFITEGLSASAMYNTTRNSFYSISRYYTPFYYNMSSYDEATGDYTLNRYNENGHEYLVYTPGEKNVSSMDYFQAILNYSRTFESLHDVSGMLVFTTQNRITGNPINFESSLPYRNVGLAGRFTYSYAQRYFAELNFGYNGSERFSKQHRFGFFPSVGLAWYVSQEPFWKNNEELSKTISKFKIRGSYGLVGNDNIGAERFYYFSRVTMNNAGYSTLFGSEFGYRLNGYSVDRYENENITWEESTKSNLSTEISFFDAINLTVDLYREYRRNILLTRSQIPNTLGFTSFPQSNTGEASSKGIDIQLEGNKSFNKDFYISLRGNFTYAKNKYEVLDEAIYAGAPWTSHVGYPINQVYGYVAERLFVDDYEVANSASQTSFAGQNTAVRGGDIKYKDIYKDGIIDERDKVAIGYPTIPEIVYGFGMSTGYKNLDFSFFFQGVDHRSFWIDVTTAGTAPFVEYGSPRRVNQILQVYADNHWSEDNRDVYALWPRLSTVNEVNNQQCSTYFMRDGSFLRLKSVELGYTLPSSLTNKFKVDKLRIYVSGTNLLCFSKFKLWDPEMAGNGLGYPIQRVFNFGINIGF